MKKYKEFFNQYPFRGLNLYRTIYVILILILSLMIIILPKDFNSDDIDSVDMTIEVREDRKFRGY